MSTYTVIDNFFENPDEIRNLALLSNYDKSSDETGWKGYRKLIDNLEISNYITERLVLIDKKFRKLQMKMFFQYSLEETKKEIKNFNKNRLHKDDSEWAGIVYLSPNPQENSGTSLCNDDGSIIENIQNLYNRFVFYRGDMLHGVENTFGNNISNGRLTLAIFGGIPKSEKTLI